MKICNRALIVAALAAAPMTGAFNPTIRTNVATVRQITGRLLFVRVRCR